MSDKPEVLLTPDGEPVTLAEAGPGLFLHGDTLCMKSEYGSNEGRIDAFIVDSGEFFWGEAPQTIASQRASIVQPLAHRISSQARPDGELVELTWHLPPHMAAGEVARMASSERIAPQADTERAQERDGYKEAFYEIADMLDIPARPLSPAVVFETEMKPRLREALGERAQIVAGETGWLIEHEGEPKWLVADLLDYWTKDSVEALRFARRVDAENYVSAFMDEQPVRITEHRWG